MPITEQHKKKKAKNLMVLAILLVLIVILFALTIIKNKPRSDNEQPAAKETQQ